MFHFRMAPTAQESSNERLCDQLNSKIITWQLNDKHFLPEDCLRDLVNVSSIKAELSATQGWFNFPVAWNSQLPTRVYDKAQKVFAILALISKVEMMKDLDQEGLTDDSLPLDRKKPNILVSRSTGKEFKTFARYSGCDRLFTDYQWQVLAPVLDLSGRDILLDKNCALPIVIAEDVPVKKGGGSSIFTGIIHKAHYREEEASSCCTGCFGFHSNTHFTGSR